MPKILCIVSLVISILIVLLFLSDLILGFAGSIAIAPFRFDSMMIDIVFTVCGAVVGMLSWFTLREQV